MSLKDKLSDVVKDETKQKIAETAAEVEMRLRKGADSVADTVTSSEQYGKWKGLTSDQRFYIGGAAVVLAFLLLAWLFWPGSAKASDCRPDIPDDAKLVCVEGKVNIYSRMADQRMEMHVSCGPSA